jgi:hypothetical protein
MHRYRYQAFLGQGLNENLVSNHSCKEELRSREPEELKLNSLPDSAVDSDPVGSETFSRIRIRKEFEYLTSGKIIKIYNLKVRIPSHGKKLTKTLISRHNMPSKTLTRR